MTGGDRAEASKGEEAGGGSELVPWTQKWQLQPMFFQIWIGFR